ncbi:MAG: thioredoxin-disulfide reductase [Planctomycetota bacterium]
MTETTTTDVRNVVIIGSGPAGLTAALYTSRAMLHPLVISGFIVGGQAGGQLMTTTEVENYPGYPEGVEGPHMMADLRKQVERFHAEFLDGYDVTSVDLSTRPYTIRTGWYDQQDKTKVIDDSGPVIKAKTLIIATGATAKWLGCKGEAEYMNRGASACATCDGALPRFRDRPLVVVGGGDTAVEEASFLTKYASKVMIVHRRDELRASKIMAKRAHEHPKIDIIWNSVLDEIKGNPKDGVTHAVLRDVKTGAITEHEVGGVFMGIGHKPNTDLFKGVIDMDETGYIKLANPPTTYTNVPGVFVCGDAADHVYRQAITAAGTGCAAAIDAERWLEAQEAGG